jgi:integrase
MSLSELAIRAAKPAQKPYKLADEKGLYLLVKPNRARLWRYKYRHAGIEKLLSFGAYPTVSLRVARERRDEARKLVANRIDPSVKGRIEKEGRANTFAAVAQEWLDIKKGSLSESTWQRDRDQLVKIVGPYLGRRPVAEIEAPELLAILKRLEKRGVVDTAHRVRAVCGRVFRYAIATGRAARDISADLKGALAPKRAQSYAAITDPIRVGQLLRAIDGYDGQSATHAAIRLAPYVFVRPGELRAAEWSEFDLTRREWRVPAQRMKMKELHIVPLSRQAASILLELQPLTAKGRYVFPAIGKRERPLSENTLGAALRRIGYTSEEMTAHGFRTIASTLLNEQGWNPDLIELQLAHKERNKVRAAYNRAQRLDERRKMMQAWADYLVRLKEAALSSCARVHPATVGPAGSNRGDEAAEASGVEAHECDLASAQAVM